MKVLNICPCCSRPLLHHVSHDREYWFCRHCWQEMPDLTVEEKHHHHQKVKVMNLSTHISKLRQPVLT